MIHQSAIDRALAPTHSEWGASRFGEWRRCGLAHDLRYHMRVAPRPRPADDLGDWLLDDTSYFAVGQLCHAILRYVQECAMGLPDCGEPEAWAEIAHAWRARQHDAASAWDTEQTALELMGAYWAHYGLPNGGWPEGCEILGVEMPLAASAGVLGDLPYTATADAILRMPGGEIVIADHKTRGQALPKDRARYARGLRTNPQFVGLSWLVQGGYADEPSKRAGGPRLIGSRDVPPAVWLNAIIKPTQTLGARFDRLLVRFEPSDLEFFEAAQAATAEGLRDCVRHDGAVPNLSACAPAIGSRCWAFEFCHGSKESRARHYVIHSDATGAKLPAETED